MNLFNERSVHKLNYKLIVATIIYHIKIRLFLKSEIGDFSGFWVRLFACAGISLIFAPYMKNILIPKTSFHGMEL